MVPQVLTFDFMRYALAAALLVGFTAPLVGVFLVQRRLSLIGDGMGHVALAGVALGVLLRQQPILVALVITVAAGVAIELIRAYGRTSSDLALAVLFYGGIAAGVVIINKVDHGQSNNLTAYLFGAITTTTPWDLFVFTLLSGTLTVVTLVLRPRLFAVANDEEYAQAMGMPVLGLNITLSVLTAVTVVISMRVVGLLLISALMVLPTASAQLLGRSFHMTQWLAVAFGTFSSIAGVVISFYADTAGGGTIVLVTITLFFLVAAVTSLRMRGRRRQRSLTHA